MLRVTRGGGYQGRPFALVDAGRLADEALGFWNGSPRQEASPGGGPSRCALPWPAGCPCATSRWTTPCTGPAPGAWRPPPAGWCTPATSASAQAPGPAIARLSSRRRAPCGRGRCSARGRGRRSPASRPRRRSARSRCVRTPCARCARRAPAWSSPTSGRATSRGSSASCRSARRWDGNW